MIVKVSDTEFVFSVGKKVRSPNIYCSNLALNCKRWKISDMAKASNLACIIQDSGGNLNLVTLLCPLQNVEGRVLLLSLKTLIRLMLSSSVVC